MVGSYVSTKWFRQSWGGQSHYPQEDCVAGGYLYGQGCLAHATVAQHHQLIQRHFACHGAGVQRGSVQRGGRDAAAAQAVVGGGLRCADDEPRRRSVRLVRATVADDGGSRRAKGEEARGVVVAASGTGARSASASIGGGVAQERFLGCRGVEASRRRGRWMASAANDRQGR